MDFDWDRLLEPPDDTLSDDDRWYVLEDLEYEAMKEDRYE